MRLIHCTLQGETLTRDDLTDLQLLRLDSLATIQVKGDGLPGPVHVAHLLAPNPQGRMYEHAESQADQGCRLEKQLEDS